MATILFALIECGLIFYGMFNGSINKMQLLFVCVVYLIATIPFLCFWVPQYISYCKVVKHGDCYIGYVTDIDIVRNGYKIIKKYNSALPRFQITYVDSDEKHSFYTDTYLEVKRVTEFRYYKCKVYVYKEKAYSSNVYYESSQKEYDDYVRGARKDKVIFPTIYVVEKNIGVSIEIVINSKRRYSYDLLDYENIKRNVKDILADYLDADKDKYIDEIKQVIVDSNNPRKIPVFSNENVNVKIVKSSD